VEFNRGRAPCRGQSANCSVPALGAFENLARDVPASLMSIAALGQELARPFERNFHIGFHSRTKAVREHDNPFRVRLPNYIGQIENGKYEQKTGRISRAFVISMLF